MRDRPATQSLPDESASPFAPVGHATRRRFLASAATVACASFAALTGCSPARSPSTDTRRSTGPTVIRRDDPPPAPPRLTIPTAEPTIRVRVASLRGGETTSVHSSTGWLRVRELGSKHPPLFMRGPIIVARHADSWAIADTGGIGPVAGGLAPVEFLPDADGAFLSIGASRYTGSLVAVATGSPATGEAPGAPGIDLVNHLPLEMYLPGVLAKELYSHWHAEAFACQAIAARSFACMEAQMNAQRRHFDVTNTQQSQAYVGMTSLAVANDAAARTRGQVLAWHGDLVPGYYSSCCGGVAGNAIDMIGPNPINDIAPLRSRDQPNACISAPVYRWTIERPADDVSRRLRAWGAAANDAAMRQLGEVAAITIAQTNAHGRPTLFHVRDRGSGGVIDLPARRLREAVDFAAPGAPAVPLAMRSAFVSVETSGRLLLFHGRGFGHGVGMCQHCAQQLATRGVSHTAMLGEFYPGAQIAQGYA